MRLTILLTLAICSSVPGCADTPHEGPGGERIIPVCLGIAYPGVTPASIVNVTWENLSVHAPYLANQINETLARGQNVTQIGATCDLVLNDMNWLLDHYRRDPSLNRTYIDPYRERYMFNISHPEGNSQIGIVPQDVYEL